MHTRWLLGLGLALVTGCGARSELRGAEAAVHTDASEPDSFAFAGVYRGQVTVTILSTDPPDEGVTGGYDTINIEVQALPDGRLFMRSYGDQPAGIAPYLQLPDGGNGGPCGEFYLRRDGGVWEYEPSLPCHSETEPLTNTTLTHGTVIFVGPSLVSTAAVVGDAPIMGFEIHRVVSHEEIVAQRVR